jgi:hypothetical protein
MHIYLRGSWLNPRSIYLAIAIYHSSCQVKDLNLEYPEEYGERTNR